METRREADALAVLGRTARLDELLRLVRGAPPCDDIPRFFVSEAASRATAFRNVLTSLVSGVSLNKILRCYPTSEDVAWARAALSEMAREAGTESGAKTMQYAQYRLLRVGDGIPRATEGTPSFRLFLEIGGESMHTINVDELSQHL